MFTFPKPSTVMTCFPTTVKQVSAAALFICDRRRLRTSDQRIQTCIHSEMADPSTVPSFRHLKNYGAGTAAALTAAQLGAFEAMLGADKVEEGPVGIGITELDLGAVEIELEGRGRICRLHEALESIVRTQSRWDNDIWLRDRSRKHHPGWVRLPLSCVDERP